MKPLDGVRVLDWTNTVAGPLATRLLVDLGADVVRIEQVPAPGEAPRGMRSHAAYLGGLTYSETERAWDREGSFNNLNRGKRSLPLDLHHPLGMEIFKRLIENANGMVTNFSARVMPNLGLDDRSLRQLNPQFVCVSITGYGRTGPKTDHLAFGPIIECESGLASLSSYDDYPVVTKNVFVDAATAVQATMAFLFHVSRPKAPGTIVDVSMLETMGILLAQEYSEARRGESIKLGAMPNAHRSHVPSGCFPCTNDEWIAISVRSDDEWRSLASTLGLERAGTYSTRKARRQSEELLKREIADATRARSASALARELRGKGIPAEKVNHAAEVLGGADGAISDGFFIASGNRAVGSLPHTGSPVVLQQVRQVGERRVPMFAEHVREVLGEWLGMGSAEVERLQQERVVGALPN